MVAMQSQLEANQGNQRIAQDGGRVESDAKSWLERAQQLASREQELDQVRAA